MTEQKRFGEVPSLIADIIKTQEEEQKSKEAAAAMHKLLEKVVYQRTQPVSNQFRHMLTNPSDDPRSALYSGT